MTAPHATIETRTETSVALHMDSETAEHLIALLYSAINFASATWAFDIHNALEDAGVMSTDEQDDAVRSLVRTHVVEGIKSERGGISDDDTFEITDETQGVFQYGGTD